MSLSDLIKNFPSLNEIKGSFGEWMTKYYSEYLTDALILHDVLVDTKDGYTSQIDLIMIGSKGIFVVEVKLYENARIYGNGKNSTWYYYIGGKKYEIYSPIKQNKKHIEHLKNFLKDFGDIPFYSVITMICQDFKVDNINADPEHPDAFVCNTLVSMTRGLKIITENKKDVLDENKKHEIFEYIKANQHTDRKARIVHKENVQEYKQRKEKDKKEKICPFCKTDLVLRKGKFGEFYGCPNFPKCRYTLKIQ